MPGWRRVTRGQEIKEVAGSPRQPGNVYGHIGF